MDDCFAEDLSQYRCHDIRKSAENVYTSGRTVLTDIQADQINTQLSADSRSTSGALFRMRLKRLHTSAFVPPLHFKIWRQLRCFFEMGSSIGEFSLRRKNC